MKYNNFILTLIALLLALHLMKPWLSPVKANAASGITKVDIVKVSGSRVDAFRGVSRIVKGSLLYNFAVDRVMAKTGMSDVALVGHSLGGVVAFEYARAYGETGEIKAVVTLGAPLRGSRLAVLGMSRAARRLHPSNPLFAEIASATLNARFLSIYSRYDQLVLPYTNSERPAADENREIDLCGHTGFFFNRAVFKIILSWLLANTTPTPDM